MLKISVKLKGSGTDPKGKGGAEMVLTGDLCEKDGKNLKLTYV